MKRLACALVWAALSTGALAEEAKTLGPADCKIVHPDPDMRLKATWTGGCKDGYADGSGTLDFTYARQEYIHYEGEVRRGAPHGKGYIREKTHRQYEGGFKDGEFDGTGTLVTWLDRYDGEFREGKFNGRGKIKYAVGGSYEGEWKDGKFHGKGTAVYINGRVFTGEFADGVPLVGETPVAPAKAKYAVRSRVPAYGSRIHYDIAWTRGVPFNKAYHEMTPAEQATVRSMYPLLDKDDEPPYPLQGTKRLYNRMAEALNATGAGGEMLMLVDVDSTGKATNASVYLMPSPDLAKVAMVLAMQEKFKPALCAGKPCAMRFPINVLFNLND